MGVHSTFTVQIELLATLFAGHKCIQCAEHNAGSGISMEVQFGFATMRCGENYEGVEEGRGVDGRKGGGGGGGLGNT